MYLSVLPTTVNAFLIKEEEKIQILVYCVSKVLLRAKGRYLKVEKLTYALIIVARNIHHYFQAYPIIGLTDQPLKQILQRLDTSGHLLKWSIELGDSTLNIDQGWLSKPKH